MQEYSTFPNKLFTVAKFFDLNDAPNDVIAAVMDIKKAIADGDYSSAAKILNSNKNELKKYSIDSSYINLIDEELCIVEKYLKAPDQQILYTSEKPSVEELDSWIQSRTMDYVSVPSQSSSLVYNGSVQTPTWENFDPEKLEIGGTYDGTDAGEYIATFTPKDQYVKWADTHTNETRDVHWRIDPTEGYIDLSQYSVWIGSDDVEIIITYSNNTGEVYATSEDTSVATVQLRSDNQILIRRASESSGNTKVKVGVLANGNAGAYEVNVYVFVSPDAYEYIEAVPVQNDEDNCRYDGTVKVPDWYGYDSEMLTLDITEEIYPGTYTATFTPRIGYKWWDRTSGAKTATWVIKKGRSYIELSKDTIVLDEDNLTETVLCESSDFAFVEFENPDSRYFTISKIYTTTSFIFTKTSTEVNYFSDFIYLYINESNLYERVSVPISVTVKKKNYSGVPTPKQYGTLTYNGTAQSPNWLYYNTEQMEISGGTIEAVNAGPYFTIFTPINNNKWADDGTTDPRGVLWVINQAPGAITLSKNSVDLNGSINTAEVTFTDNTGTVSVTSSDTSVATASVSGSTITISLGTVISGEATITVNVEESENYMSTSDIISVYTSSLLLTVPSQSGVLYYTGSVQSPSWYDYNSTQLTISGKTSATAVGSYIASFTPKVGYAWRSDNTRTAKSVIWKISKAATTLSVSQTEVYLTTQHPSDILYVNTNAEVFNYTLTDPGNWVEVTRSDNKLTISRRTENSQGNASLLVYTQDSSHEYAEVTVSIYVYKDTEEIQKPTYDTTSFTYNGSSQGPLWTGYDSSTMTLSGTTQATNAGTYTTTFTPKEGYSWPSGNDPYTVTWTIAKADGFLSLSTYSATLDETNPYAYVDILSASGSVTLNYNSEHVSVTKSGNRLTITKVADYSVSYTFVQVIVDESSNYKRYTGTTDDYIKVKIIGGIVIDELPTQSNTLTYNTNPLSPTWNYHGFEGALQITGGTTSANNAGIYYTRFTPTDGSQWWDGSTGYKEASWKINKAPSYIDFSSRTPTLKGEGDYIDITVYVDGSSGNIGIDARDRDIADFNELSSNVFRIISYANVDAVAEFDVWVESDDNYLSEFVKLYVTVQKSSGIYGAIWAGDASSVWARTDDAASFSNPTSSSSPFDNIAPWSQMTRVSSSEAGTLVKIPKYYYKWKKSGTFLSLQISEDYFDGSHVSPAHEDRGDGKGERDVVYVGAYQCSDSYQSTSGNAVLKSKTRAQFRTGIHNLGSDIWQWDYATYWTIMMLMLVEYADWDVQSRIGVGYMTGASYADVTGKTDGLTRHTGSYNNHVRYRYIEDLWGNMKTFVDGITMNGTGIYIITTPDDFTDTKSSISIAERYKRTASSTKSIISEYRIPTAPYDWALIPSNAVSTKRTYTTDAFTITNTTTVTLTISNAYSTNDTTNMQYGPFSWGGTSATASSTTIGARLMVLP